MNTKNEVIEKAKREIEKLNSKKEKALSKQEEIKQKLNEAKAVVAEIDKAIEQQRDIIDVETMKSLKAAAQNNGISVEDMISLVSDNIGEFLELVAPETATAAEDTSDEVSEEDTDEEDDEEEEAAPEAEYNY